MQKLAHSMDVTVPNSEVFNNTLYEVLETVDNLEGSELVKGSLPARLSTVSKTSYRVLKILNGRVSALALCKPIITQSLYV